MDDLLIKPVQRIPRYLLFIKDLLKHTATSHPDHAPLQQALEELKGLVERVNESEREMARTEKQRELLASVDGLALVSLHTPTHTLSPAKNSLSCKFIILNSRVYSFIKVLCFQLHLHCVLL